MKACYWLLLLALLPAPSTIRSAETEPPHATIDRFVDFYLHRYRKGFPGAEERETLRPLVTPGFMATLDDAASGMECHLEATGGNEPPPSQGDIFVSLFEGATAADGIDEAEVSASQAVYAVHWVYKDAYPGREHLPQVDWTDRVILKWVDGQWLIDDFSHDGDWEFMTKGSLRSHLSWVASFCKRHH